jgi:hypothetical protein
MLRTNRISEFDIGLRMAAQYNFIELDNKFYHIDISNVTLNNKIKLKNV